MTGQGCRRWCLGLLAGLLAAGIVAGSAVAEQANLLVFGAASLKDALDDAGAVYAQQKGVKITASYAASSALAKQIESGAPADLFISADVPWMDYVAERHLIKDATRRDLLGNELVLVAAKGAAHDLTIGKGFPLAKALGNGKLAMADPNAVPAGKYGKAALQALGVWTDVEPKVASAENVRAALAFVARGEAPFGIVYSTDAAAEPGVEIVGTFPADTHPPIIYPAAVLASSKKPEAEAFLAWLGSSAAAPIFVKHGFKVVSQSS